MAEKTNSPYLKADRLKDVIAAIQVTGKYAFYKLSPSDWSMRISGDNSKSEYWKNVFSEHPEFFRFNGAGDKVSLAWRRSYRKRYSVDDERNLSFEEFSNLNEEQKKRISRTPLTGDELSILINTAINLHTRAIEQNKEHRWLSSPLFSLLGVALGAFLGWLAK
ncbi:N-carbamoyl-L-amino acid amidohydrolase [Aestuariibacter sp. A3R04]|uniref:N-carbamoyl-L-amino acid amidohydrolase n=1 Tax=Aestuariibacter sp. A3R04 TaxID=2841571 RepID=UPI001C08E628|nr:N-carbamoyl-L-amino acid amidohydrolase [Aestuariibacter sp. A3R04]MBU3023494.1 N-carbamoyl-L-amino acid amidohydrolase [Aestuariibacter sp. A3R04]